MKLHKIKKQKLLSEPYSLDVLKLARAIYYTHINDDNLYMVIKISSIYNLLKLDANKKSKNYIKKVFSELNEPLAVKNFKFYSRTYPNKFVSFCQYRINGDVIEIEISEEFLAVEHDYMLDNFLTN